MLSRAAKKRMTAILANSEGWNSIPSFSHRRAWLWVTPNGVNTRTRRTIEPIRAGMDIQRKV